MKTYEVTIPVIARLYFEIEAENKNEAINKALQENGLDGTISLCCQCSDELCGTEQLEIDFENITVD